MPAPRDRQHAALNYVVGQGLSPRVQIGGSRLRNTSLVEPAAIYRHPNRTKGPPPPTRSGPGFRRQRAKGQRALLCVGHEKLERSGQSLEKRGFRASASAPASRLAPEPRAPRRPRKGRLSACANACLCDNESGTGVVIHLEVTDPRVERSRARVPSRAQWTVRSRLPLGDEAEARRRCWPPVSLGDRRRPQAPFPTPLGRIRLRAPSRSPRSPGHAGPCVADRSGGCSASSVI